MQQRRGGPHSGPRWCSAPHAEAPQSTPSREPPALSPAAEIPPSTSTAVAPGTPEEEKTPGQGHFLLSLKLPCRPVTFVTSEPQTLPGRHASAVHSPTRMPVGFCATQPCGSARVRDYKRSETRAITKGERLFSKGCKRKQEKLYFKFAL